jgi:hypothetical protein
MPQIQGEEELDIKEFFFLGINKKQKFQKDIT